MSITAVQLSGWSDVPVTDSTMEPVVSATNSYVATLPIVANLAEGEEWPGTVTLGAMMLGARLLRRRNSPNGVEALTSDAVSYVARYDSDIARMLGLDGFEKPAIG